MSPPPPATCSAVAIKVPEFMETAVSGWFAIIEAQFHLRNVTDPTTKYFHVISHLPPDVVAKLSPAILTSQKYDELKDSVVSSYEKTKPELFSKLISETKMTGRPSAYLSELLAIANKVGVGDDLVRHRFTQSLPSSIAPVIAAQQDLSLQQIGKLADELMPLCKNDSYSVNEIKQNENKNSQHQPRQDFKNYPPTFQPFSRGQKPKICRGHIYFADASKTCKPWCKYPNKSSCRIQPTSRSASPSPGDQSENS